MSRSRRPTVGGEQCRRPAISLVGIAFHLPHAQLIRSSSSVNLARSRWHSSAVSAANSGVGSLPTTCSQPPLRNRPSSGAIKRRVAAHPSAAPLEAALPFLYVGGLAGRYDDEQLPKTLPVVQLREAAALGPAAEAIEGAEGRVLFVLRPADGLRAALVGPEPPSERSRSPRVSGRRRRLRP